MASRTDRKRIVRLCAAVMIAAAALVLLPAQRTGLRLERVAVDSDVLLELAVGGRKVSKEDMVRLSGIVAKGALLHGHNWVSETVDEAGTESSAPWSALDISIGPPEKVADGDNPVLMKRLEGILGIVAEASGNDPSDFAVHIASGRGVSAYSLVDGSIYLSYMLAAGCTDDQVAR